MLTSLLQSNKEKIIFYSLVSLLFMSIGFYIFCIESTVHNVVKRQNLENEAAQLSLSIGREEFEYINMRNGITLETAHSLGFKDVSDKKFVYKTSLGFAPAIAKAL